MRTIRFIGPWARQEQQALRIALREVQQFVDFHISQSMIGKQWVCRCVSEGERRLYSARHPELTWEVQDYSFLGLLKRIYRLTWERGETRFAHPNSLFVHR